MLIRHLILDQTNFMIFRLFLLKRLNKSVGVRSLKLATFPHKKKDVAKKAAARKKTTSQYRSCLHTYVSFTTISQGGTSLIPMDADIYGYEGMTTIIRRIWNKYFNI